MRERRKVRLASEDCRSGAKFMTPDLEKCFKVVEKTLVEIPFFFPSEKVQKPSYFYQQF